MPRQVKPYSGFTRRLPRAGLHIRTSVSGQSFVYLDDQKICRYLPDRQALEFMDHHKGGRVVEANIAEFAAGLKRLTEAPLDNSEKLR